jgi:hypothetical protein
VVDETGDDTADVVALWRLQALYADIVTRRAWPELTDVICEDATIEIDTVTAAAYHFVGPQQLGAFIGGAVERFDHFAFVVLNTVVDIDGADSARGRIFMSEIRREAATSEWTTTYGLYQDRYRRVDGRWWFADRHYRSLARTGANGGVFGVPADLERFGR